MNKNENEYIKSLNYIKVLAKKQRKLFNKMIDNQREIELANYVCHSCLKVFAYIYPADEIYCKFGINQ